jgi:hypothetical protein
VGIFGAIVDTTDVSMILRLDCNATDFYASKPYPVYLYYNPYPVTREVTYTASHEADVFDIVSKKYVAKGVARHAKVKIPAHSASILVELPAGSKIEKKNDKLMVGNHVIAFK